VNLSKQSDMKVSGRFGKNPMFMRNAEHLTQTLSDILGGKNRPFEESVSSDATSAPVTIGAVAIVPLLVRKADFKRSCRVVTPRVAKLRSFASVTI